MKSAMYPVWLTTAEGAVINCIASPGAFTCRMYPEAIAALEERFNCTLAKIATDTEDNVIWKAA